MRRRGRGKVVVVGEIARPADVGKADRVVSTHFVLLAQRAYVTASPHLAPV